MSLIHVKQGERTVPVSDENPLPIGGFSIPKYDNIVMTYDVDNNVETVTYTLEGEQVAMLTLTYTAGNLTSVVRS